MLRIKVIKFTTILLIVLVNIGCDQVSKSIVRGNLDADTNIHLLDNHVMLTNVENSGAFLSAGDTLPPLAKTLMLSLFPAMTLLVLLYWLFSQQGLSRGAVFGLSCIVGGGIGNIFDRIVHGSVTDFLYIHLGIFRTGIFNFADVSITGGVLLLALVQLFSLRKG
jgi:signal peptidase II